MVRISKHLYKIYWPITILFLHICEVLTLFVKNNKEKLFLDHVKNTPLVTLSEGENISFQIWLEKRNISWQKKDVIPYRNYRRYLESAVRQSITFWREMSSAGSSWMEENTEFPKRVLMTGWTNSPNKDSLS